MTTPTDMDIVQAARLHIQTLRTIADLFESQLGLENPSESAGILHRQAAAEIPSRNGGPYTQHASAAYNQGVAFHQNLGASVAALRDSFIHLNQTVERMTYDANERIETFAQPNNNGNPFAGRPPVPATQTPKPVSTQVKNRVPVRQLFHTPTGNENLTSSQINQYSNNQYTPYTPSTGEKLASLLRGAKSQEEANAISRNFLEVEEKRRAALERVMDRQFSANAHSERLHAREIESFSQQQQKFYAHMTEQSQKSHAQERDTIVQQHMPQLNESYDAEFIARSPHSSLWSNSTMNNSTTLDLRSPNPSTPAFATHLEAARVEQPEAANN